MEKSRSPGELRCTDKPRFIGVFRSMGELRATEMREARHFPRAA